VDLDVLSSPIIIDPVAHLYAATDENANASSMWFVCGSRPLSDVVMTLREAMLIVVVTVLHVSRSKLRILHVFAHLQEIFCGVCLELKWHFKHLLKLMSAGIRCTSFVSPITKNWLL
jgi:hypothetical protein